MELGGRLGWAGGEEKWVDNGFGREPWLFPETALHCTNCTGTALRSSLFLLPLKVSPLVLIAGPGARWPGSGQTPKPVFGQPRLLI